MLQPGKLYTPSGAAEIRDDFLADVRLEAIRGGCAEPPVQPKTDWFILGTAVGNLGLMQYANERIADDNSSDLDATGDALDDRRKALGLPEVSLSPASGAVTVELTDALVHAVPDGTQIVLPNGLRAKVDGLQFVSPAALDVNVVAVDPGASSNTAAGKAVQFVSPPAGLKTAAKVSVSSPLQGGADKENDERKRDRILNRRRNVPAGGNWGYLIETALNSLGTLQYAFVYPALGGPSSIKVVLTKSFDADFSDYSREVTPSALSIVRRGIQAAMPGGQEIVVQSAEDEATNISLGVTIPDASTAGGNGLGWVDARPWPQLVGAETKVTISAVTANDRITVTSIDVPPVAAQTRVMWWNPTDMRFEQRLVTAVAGAAGAWDITLDRPLATSAGGPPLAGQYISPACVNGDKYGKEMISVFTRLGPGENTADAHRLPRASRHPFPEDSYQNTVGANVIAKMMTAFPEVTDADWLYRSKTAPTIPALVATAPNVLVPGHFGIYSL